MVRPADGTTVAGVFDPARLTLARESAAYSKKHLAEAIGRTPSAMTQYEAGLSRPSGPVLDACANTLGVPVGFLPTRIDLTALLNLQQRWGVSVAALLYRCRELGTLTEASATPNCNSSSTSDRVRKLTRTG